MIHVQEKKLADGLLEIRATHPDGSFHSVHELKPCYHALFVAHLLEFEAEVAALEASALHECRVLTFPTPLDLPLSASA